MLRVLEPVGGTSLPRVSPKIRSLQDRLIDSLPTDGAWECLSPAQREAILSLHRNRIFGNSGSHNNNNNTTNNNSNNNNNTAVSNSNHLDEEASRGRKGVFVLGRFTHARSKSYDDKLESETDDSGARGLGGGGGGTTSSGTQSHNSQEDDSSDPGVNRPRTAGDANGCAGGGGRFLKSGIKSSSCDRVNLYRSRTQFEGGKVFTEHYIGNKSRAPVTNGFGNVNKMISKQMNKNVGVNSANITLDCRNIQGEKRRRTCIFSEEEDPFEDGDFNDDRANSPVRASNIRHIEPVPSDRAGMSRRKILNKYETAEVFKVAATTTPSRATPTLEEYDSGVNFRLDSMEDSTDSFVKEQPRSLSYLVNSGALNSNNVANNFNQNRGYYSGNFIMDHKNNFSGSKWTKSEEYSKGNSDSRKLVTSKNTENARNLEHSFNDRNNDKIAANRNGWNHNPDRFMLKRPHTIDVSNLLKPPHHLSQSSSCSTNNALTSNPSAGSESTSSSEGHRVLAESRVKVEAVDPPLKSNLKSSCGARMNSSLDYRSTMNQDVHNRYSNNWNELICNNNVPSKYNLKLNKCFENEFHRQYNPLTKSTSNLLAKNYNSGKNEVNFMRNNLKSWANEKPASPKKYIRSKSLDRKYMDDTSDEESDFEARRRIDRELRYTRNPDYESLRAKQGELGYVKNANVPHSSTGYRDYCGRTNKVNWETTLAADITLQRQYDQYKRSPPAGRRAKAQSAWDLSSTGDVRDEFDDPDEIFGYRSRGEMRSRWQKFGQELNDDVNYRTENHFVEGRRNIRSTFTPKPNRRNAHGLADVTNHSLSPTRHRKRVDIDDEFTVTQKSPLMNRLNETYNVAVNDDFPEKQRWKRTEFEKTQQFTKKQLKRRSCDFELDGPSADERSSKDPLHLDRKKWYRRSCDLDLDFDQHYQHDKQFFEEKGREAFIRSTAAEQFQSLPAYHEGLHFPEEITFDQKRCPGRREISARLRPGYANDRADLDSGLSQSPEVVMLESGHDMYVMDKACISYRENSTRVDGRSTSRMEENLRRSSNGYVINNCQSSKNIFEDRPKTSIGNYGKVKHEQSRTPPHGLKGKLRIFKSILSF